MGQSGKSQTTLLTPVDVMKADWLSKRGGSMKKLSPLSSDKSPTVFGRQKKLVEVKTLKDLPEYIVDSGTKTTYLRGKFLGKGGFARVHELTDLTTGQVYAGKIIPKSRLTKPHQREKILREIDLHRKLQHNNVVRFHHFFEDDQNAYIILENCPKKSLVHVLKNRKFLTEPEVRYFMLQLAEGVKYTHSQGVIHRDLKLGNMFLTEDMEMKIGDFGLAAHFSSLDNKAGKKFTVCGTPNYIAPEVLNMQGHSFAADVWAMGCIMYALLVGQPPFETTTLNETYYRITTNKFIIPNSMSEAARHLVIKMLQCKPADRPSLPEIIQHRFFVSGYLPNSLPTTCCVTVPKFPFAASLVKRQNENKSQEQSDQLIKHITDLQLNPKSQMLDRPKIQPKYETSPPSSPKKNKCFPSNFKQKLTNVLCPDKVKKVKRPISHSQIMYTMVQNALESIPLDCETNPAPLKENLSPFITKWIDYSNKYGFGFQLSDHSIGVIFNDSTRMSLSSNRGRVEFHDMNGKMSSYSQSNVPKQLEEKFILLNVFVHYMDENLTEGGELENKDLVKKKNAVPHMKRWLRSSYAIIMQLSTGTLQINFFKDHTKIVIGGDGSVMYINEERHSQTFSLAQFCQYGCQPGIRSRLQYAASVLQDFAQLEGDAS